MSTEPEWLVPASLDEALALRAERREGATVVAGGTFVGILVNSRLMAPEAFLSLQRVAGLDYIRADGDLRIGALTTHRAVELSPVVREGWPALAHAFSAVASPRVRNQATVGGVLADTTVMPWARASRTRRNPGSEIPGVPASVTSATDLPSPSCRRICGPRVSLLCS